MHTCVSLRCNVWALVFVHRPMYTADGIVKMTRSMTLVEQFHRFWATYYSNKEAPNTAFLPHTCRRSEIRWQHDVQFSLYSVHYSFNDEMLSYDRLADRYQTGSYALVGPLLTNYLSPHVLMLNQNEITNRELIIISSQFYDFHHRCQHNISHPTC